MCLTVHAVNGRRVATLLDAPRAAGRHVVEWSGLGTHGERLPNGIYFCRLSTASGDTVKRIVLLQ